MTISLCFSASFGFSGKAQMQRDSSTVVMVERVLVQLQYEYISVSLYFSASLRFLRVGTIAKRFEYIPKGCTSTALAPRGIQDCFSLFFKF
jgi:hypothetical protein